MRTAIVALALSALTTAVAASEFWPGADYDPQAPDYQQVLGYQPGERISDPREIRAWFEALEQAYPNRIEVVPYAESWQGRALFYAVIGTPERIRNLDAIRADIQAIAQPHEHDEAAVQAAMERVPGTVWLSYSVHGDEISPADAAMYTAYHLLAARDDEVVDSILERNLVFIDPMQNPDGRARFIHSFEAAEGLEPAASRLAAEHDQPWPSGRVNHYLFDLNRDWLAITQPETQGRVEALLQWYPLAFVDAHEMGSDASFFFAPEAVPYNPHLANNQRESLKLFGHNNARWFDRFGFEYFTREIFDAFYPGYGASWPSYYGGVAMTYEQGSAAGLVIRRRDTTELTYAESVRHHFVASLATAQTVAEHRDRLWRDFRDYRTSAIEQPGKQGPRNYVIPAQTDQSGADRLAAVLASHGIDMHRSDGAINACGREFGSGSYVVPAAQPAYRKLRVLLDRQVAMSEDFVAEQERRRAKDLPDQIYDVTAWSLPLMFNVETLRCNDRIATGNMELVEPGQTPAGEVRGDEAAVAWLVAGGSRSTGKFMTRALRAGLYVLSSEEAFTHDGHQYPSGSLILPVAQNPNSLRSSLSTIAAQTGANAVAADDSWITEGPNFGSNKVRRLHEPRVAIAWDRPTDTYAPGAARFVLERQFGLPVVPIRTHTLAGADLGRFDVVILPDSSGYWGDYADVLGTSGRDNLRAWVKAGGVLVTLAGATEWAAHPDTDLLSIRAEHQARPETGSDDGGKGGTDAEAETDDDSPRVSGTILEHAQAFQQAVQPEDEPPDPVAGALVKARVDPDHWLASGVAEHLNVLVRGDRVFRPIKRDHGRNVARFAAADELLQSGKLWAENRRQLAFKPFVVVEPSGRGMVIAFTEDPTVRAYLDGLNMIFLNAVLRAPSYSDKLR